MSTPEGKIRLNKYLALAGLGGRNATTMMIKSGAVEVNGEKVLLPYHEVSPKDRVTYNGKPVTTIKKEAYVVINKSSKSPVFETEGSKRPSLQFLAKRWCNDTLKPLGNPDDVTSGLVIMTSDEKLVEKIAKAGHQIKMVFEVTLSQPLTQEDLLRLLNQTVRPGVRIMGISHINKEDKVKVGMEMLGGSYGDVFKLFDSVGYNLLKVDCTFLGGITKKDLKRGWGRLLTEKEIVFIKHFS